MYHYFYFIRILNGTLFPIINLALVSKALNFSYFKYLSDNLDIYVSNFLKDTICYPSISFDSLDF
jgi:hypothetical protein